jgi:gliding motility-associated-like protein
MVLYGPASLILHIKFISIVYMRFLIGLLPIALLPLAVVGQPCTTPGQNPGTAFPVCGTSIFTQSAVPSCGGTRVPNPSCTAQLTDINPFWYKFTCFQTGTLGFEITPNNLAADYDWQVFDVTGRIPNEVYSNVGLVVGSNWSGEGGVTGASSAGSQIFVCDGLGRPLFSRMPTITAGRDYLLLVSNFASGETGYKLEFKGGTAVITDPTEPLMKRVEANCGGDILRLKLNKKMKCNSMSADGSDFFITPAGVVNPTSAVGINCGTNFDSDSLEIRLNQPLPPGNYVLNVKNGSDGNTILDYCDKPIQLTNSIPFVILPKAPTPMDSLNPLRCAPTNLILVFNKNINCNSVASDGSDFVVTGTYPVTVTGASGNCAVGSTGSKIITVTLSQPLQVAGNFVLTLQRGSDGNTLIDECNEETLAGSSLIFSVKDTVNANFGYTAILGCDVDVVNYTHPGGNSVNVWEWSLDEGLTSNQQNPTASYRIFNEKTVTLRASNGFCSDTVMQKVDLPNFFTAEFTAPEFNCPNEPVPFSFSGVGNTTQYSWNFGDGATGNGRNVSHTFPVFDVNRTYTVRLTVTDVLGCQKTVQKNIAIVRSCFIGVPKAFTPNGDGLNETLYPMYAVKARDLSFRVFNRWGQMLFSTNDWRNGWDGTFKGQGQDPGTYVWILRYTNVDTGKLVEERGTTILIR